MALDRAERAALARLEADLRSEDAELVHRFDLLSRHPRRGWRALAVPAIAVAAVTAGWAVWTVGPPAIALIGMCLVLASPWVAVWAADVAERDRRRIQPPPRPVGAPVRHRTPLWHLHTARWGMRH